MKSVFAIAVLTLCSNFAFADEILCASKKDQSLYYTEGQIRVVAEIDNETTLMNVVLSTTGSDKLRSSDDEAKGQVRGQYVRFALFGDAWCSYRLTLPTNFMKTEKTTAYVDAFCEENANASIRLNCIVR